MRFAKIVFITAGVWGIVVLLPLNFLVDVTGRRYAPPTAYPQFFYGFLVVAMAWQVGFLVVGSNPERFRLLMLPCTIEKLGYVATLVILRSQDRISNADAAAVVPDLLLGLLFIAAFAKTRKRPDAAVQSLAKQRTMARFLIEVPHDPGRAAGMQQLGAIPGGAQPDTGLRLRFTRRRSAGAREEAT